MGKSSFSVFLVFCLFYLLAGCSGVDYYYVEHHSMYRPGYYGNTYGDVAVISGVGAVGSGYLFNDPYYRYYYPYYNYPYYFHHPRYYRYR
jgi:hypothetical protein